MKKNLIITLAAIIAVTALNGCDKKSETASESTSFDKNTSYALGVIFGMDIRNNIESNGIDPDYNELVKGFKDAITGKGTRYDQYEAMEMVDMAFTAASEAKNAGALEKETEFLVENGKRAGVTTTASGLQYEILVETSGPKPAMNDLARVHYEGKLIDGTIFDSSYQYGEPVSFPVAEVIQGFTEGLQLMSIGSKYIFYIPYDLGYGPSAYGPIPAYATLIFTVELIDIIK